MACVSEPFEITVLSPVEESVDLYRISCSFSTNNCHLNVFLFTESELLITKKQDLIGIFECFAWMGSNHATAF